ncbi:MAG: RloB family protein [Opitutales bacterium]
MNRKTRKGFRRPSRPQRTKKFVVVAAEGKETEPRYFEAFATPREAETQIKIVPNPKDESKPKEVLARLKRFFNRNYSKARGDEAWMVIDRDDFPEDDLRSVYRDAKALGFHVLMSNPCFELWLYLHLRDHCPFTDRHDCQRKLAAVLPGYSPDSKGNYAIGPLMENLDQAIERAKAKDTKPHQPWPTGQVTCVYKLVERLLEAAKASKAGS